MSENDMDAARRFAVEMWGATWADAEMRALLEFAALAAQAPKQGGAEWYSMSERPQSGRKIIALYNDGSGAVMLWFDGDLSINSDGEECEWPQTGFDRWTYLPDNLEFWCELGDEDRITFPAPPLAAAPNPPAGEAVGGTTVAVPWGEGKPDGGENGVGAVVFPPWGLGKSDGGEDGSGAVVRPPWGPGEDGAATAPDADPSVGEAVGGATQSEIDQIRAMLLADQGDDDGSQIMPDFEEGMSTYAMVSRCVHLLEQRRDVLDSHRAKSAAPAPQTDDLAGLSAGALAAALKPYASPDGTLFTLGASDLADVARRLVPAPAAPQAPAEPVAWDDPASINRPVAYAWECQDNTGAWHGRITADKPALTGAVRDIYPLFAAPAASRIGVSEETIARAIDPEAHDNWHRQFKHQREVVGQMTEKASEAASCYFPEYGRARRQARAVLALLAAPRAGGEMADGWQPIETAPSDYEWTVELPGQEDSGVGFALDDDTGQAAFLIWFDSPKPYNSKPTYWRPLPAPPAEQDANHGGGR